MSFVTLEHRGPVGLITMNRPEALNALNDQVLRELDAVLDQVEADDSILVAVITGAGRSFVAGADIGQMSTLTAAEAKAFGVLGNRVFLKLENLTKPTIAAVNGFALGGGCELSMACDIRVASEKAKFGQPEVGLGITPGCGGTHAVCALAGGHLWESFRYHPFVLYTGLLFLVFVVWNSLCTVVNKKTGGRKLPFFHFHTAWVYIGLAILLIQWIVKNVLLFV